MIKCDCGSGVAYRECCEPYITGKSHAPTAEALMRSRYTAYVKEEIDYIDQTHHPKFAHDFDKEAAKAWAKESDWQGLKVIRSEKGGTNDQKGVVEFIASYKTGGQDAQHQEIAHFAKVDDRWLYTEGTIVGAQPIKRVEPKLGRNDPCSCGSGKKYKKCCL